MRTLEWNLELQSLQMIDQRLLPAELRLVQCRDYQQVIQAIREMTVRGAPAIGAAAAFGLALAAQESVAQDLPALRSELKLAGAALLAARPTAVNLSWALQRVLQAVHAYVGSPAGLRQLVLHEAQQIADEDVEINRRMALYGAALLDDGDRVIHHCNTGALAAVDWGTALGAIRMAHEQGKKIHVLVDETRPRLQGARLTAWELEQYGIPYEIITDGAAGYHLAGGLVQKVFFGADRVAANGDVANKIGTYMLALAARDNGIPVYAVVPTSTIDLSLAHGGLIPVEQRSEQEVLNISVDGKPVFPAHARARNPAFDITPHRLITAIVSEKGVVFPPFVINLRRIFQENS